MVVTTPPPPARASAHKSTDRLLGLGVKGRCLARRNDRNAHLLDPENLRTVPFYTGMMRSSVIPVLDFLGTV